MRIALIAQQVNRRSGVPRCVAELIAYFSRQHEVTVFAESITDLEDYRFRFIKLPTFSLSRFTSHASFNISGTIAVNIARLTQRENFDIIHSTVGPGLHANVVTWHFCQEAEWRLLKEGVFKASSGLSKLQNLDYELYRRFMRNRERAIFEGKGPEGLIVVSDQMKRDMQEFYGSNGREIFVVPNAVDSNKFHPQNRGLFRNSVRQSHGIRAETPVILFVGGDWERKGLQIVISALARVQRTDTLLLVVGPGDKSEYIKLAERNGVADRIVFAGISSKVEQYYAAADVMAFPSLYEPYGLVVPEAMASGLPVVISASVGASFLVTDELDGFVVENGLDEVAFTDKLNLVLNDEVLRRKIGDIARLTAAKLSWDNVAEETLRVYYRVLDARKALIEVNNAKRSHPIER